MLILSRRIGESIIINEDITVTVLDLHGNQIKLGISAPKNVSVHREEIFLKIIAEREAEEDDNETT